MSFHTSDGHRRSARNAAIPPLADPDLSSSDDGTTILYHEDDVTTMAPSLTPPILSNHPTNRHIDTATTDIPSVRSSEVSIGHSRDPPSNNGDPPYSQHRGHGQNQHLSRTRTRAYSSRPTRSGADSIPESITTQGGLHPDTARVHQQVQLDDLTTRVLTLDTRLNHQNELLQSSLQQIMQALNLPLPIGSNDSERIVLGGRGGDKSHPQNNIPLKVSWADIVTGKR